jgi:signal transduction histidine kinase
MTFRFDKNSLYLVVFLIGVLLILNIVLTRKNNDVIKSNQVVSAEVEKTKLYYDQIGKTVIHSIDIGLRGYALVQTEKLGKPLESGINWKDSILNNVERPLKKLNYDFSKYNVLKDSLNQYAKFCLQLKQLLDQGEKEKFTKLFASDRGAHLWWLYLQVEKDIAQYVDKIDVEAKQEYESALLQNQIIQVILFLICFPTLLYTAFNTSKTVTLFAMLRKAEREKNTFLSEQNILLERKVAERTQEITAQNEEILSQSEELASHRDALAQQNKQLQETYTIIENQNSKIQSINKDLKIDVENRTHELQEANKELVDQNTQLEQFAFIAAHNLRSPVARILGLTNLIRISDNDSDKELAFEKLVTSTNDLDHVIRDLSNILNIKKHNRNIEEVDLHVSFSRVTRILEKELEESGTQLVSSFSEEPTVYAVGPYVESILFNLISNAIKYSDPERKPVIQVRSVQEEGFICLSVSDNGLGIDLSKYKQSMFSLYKRFHLHREGRGLGLYLVKTQIEALGGYVDVKSELNSGTTFLIYFKKY